jgi:cell wall-associated NlpC family hydrolase
MKDAGVATAGRHANQETSSAATKLRGSRGLSHRSFLQSKRMVHLPGRVTAVLLSMLALLSTLASPGMAEPGDQQWDPTLPKLVSSGAPGDPVAIANASLQATQFATQTTMELGRKFLSSLGLGGTGAGAPTSVAPGSLNRVNGRQAIEYVIRRGASQAGVPYSWGGGKPNGPSLGVDSGADTVGYDCSGFTQFAFAGVGVLIPKFSGDQYNTGRKVPPSQAKRGDLIFYGPGGTQHVAIYLGNGQVLESASSYGQVGVHPLRTAGMSPYLARIIES